MQPVVRFLLFLLPCYGCWSKKEYTTWRYYKGSLKNVHDSSLMEMDTVNINKRQVAWAFRTGNADTIHSYSTTQSLWRGSFTAPRQEWDWFALDATSGKKRMKNSGPLPNAMANCRGRLTCRLWPLRHLLFMT